MNTDATNKYNLQIQVINLLTKLTIVVRYSARNQLMPQLHWKKPLLALRRRNTQTILLQEICIEIENAGAFTTNEIAKTHVKFNPSHTGAKVRLQHLISSLAASRAQEFQVGKLAVDKP